MDALLTITGFRVSAGAWGGAGIGIVIWLGDEAWPINPNGAGGGAEHEGSECIVVSFSEVLLLDIASLLLFDDFVDAFFPCSELGLIFWNNMNNWKGVSLKCKGGFQKMINFKVTNNECLA